MIDAAERMHSATTLLLEPVAGCAWSDTLWSMRLTGWRPEGPLPVGVSLAGDGMQGCLHREALLAWAAALRAAGDLFLAETVSRTLTAHEAPPTRLAWPGGALDLSRPRVMGIINVTPDSFSGDGLHHRLEAAVAQGLRMAAEGADILDVGGESSRPGAEPVGCEEELQRVVPVVQRLVQVVGLPISVDTRKPEVMEAALDAGASWINDVTALREVGAGSFMSRVLAGRAAPIVLMHMQGRPATMQQAPHYGDLLAEVYGFLAERVAWCVAHGIARSRLILDPGIGFGKSPAHNLQLLRHLRVFRGLGLPLLLGVSRKRLVGTLTGEESAERREVGSHVLAALGVLNGAQILRVHDVAGARQAVAVAHGWAHGVP
ncbi:MAG: dihydropteroate synthase [Magnetococcus sp. MYC-9]